MRDSGSFRRESEHPLFRVLVLMGGSLALGCGGSAVMDGSAASGGGGTPAGGGVAQGGAAQGGAGGASAQGGTAGVAGAADCPPAQWDCSARAQVCAYSWQGSARPDGCVCDPKRPKSIADCGPNENLLCLSAYRDPLYPEPQSWDGSLHVQCACAPGPAVPSFDTCKADCATAYPSLVAASGSGTFVACNLPPSMACDPAGNNCTATPNSVLRQDGVLCGCASVSLK